MSTRKIGAVDWCGGFDQKRGRHNNFGFLKDIDSNQDIYFHFRDVECSIEDLNSGILVTYEEDYQGAKTRAKKVHRIEDESDSRTLAKCFHHEDIRIASLVSKKYLTQHLPLYSAIERAGQKLNSLNVAQQKTFINSIPEKLIIDPQSVSIREKLEIESRINSITKLIGCHSRRKLQLTSIDEEISDTLLTASYRQKEKFWQDVEGQVEYHGFLWNIASKSTRIKKIKERFPLLQDLDSFREKAIISLRERERLIRFSPNSIYEQLTEKDWQLSEKWIPDGEIENSPDKKAGHTAYTKATMISARAAEKVAKLFFENLSFAVEDTALHQITVGGELWKKCDLVLNHQIYVDVKNSRTSTNNKKGSLSEFCIPEFKKNREGKDIIIFGVLSPYLKFEEIKNNDFGRLRKQGRTGITVLGEIKRSEMQRLSDKYSTNFLSIDMPRLSNERYLPAWILDYSSVFYQDIIDYRELGTTNLPPMNEALMANPYSLAALAWKKASLPNSWLNTALINQEGYSSKHL